MKFKPFYLIILFLFVVLVLAAFGVFDAPEGPPKLVVKKDNKAAAKVIKQEQEKRRQWQQDSIKLVQQVDTLSQSNEQLRQKINNNKQKQHEVSNYTKLNTDDQYNGFFAKRYGK